ncbi:MAG: substrate-binding domain-containing protein [Bradymonadaceae bacterium]
MSRRFKVGGVPEHFNLPWYRAAERDVFDDAPFDYSWEIYPGGTGAMLADLDSGELDLAVLLMEGVVAHIARGGDAAILGTYVDSPLIWGVHVHADSPFASIDDLRGKKFGISRRFSGSHIMAYVLAEEMGWSPTDDITFELVKDLEGAREALKEGRADAFMWEKYTTKPLVDTGEWRRAGVCTTPWPPFVLASKRGFASERWDDVELVIERIKALCDEMTDDPTSTVSNVTSRFGQRERDARQWLSETRWASELVVDPTELEGVVDTLLRVGVIDERIAVANLVLNRSEVE